MRLATILLALVLGAFAVTAAASAAALERFAAQDRDRLSLSGGRGTALLVSRGGAVVGSMTFGRVRIYDVADRVGTEYSCRPNRRWVARRTIECYGSDVGFHAYGGRWRVRVTGRGINASAVMSGYVTLRGTAGTYRVNDGRRRAWPRTARTITLGG